MVSFRKTLVQNQAIHEALTKELLPDHDIPEKQKKQQINDRTITNFILKTKF